MNYVALMGNLTKDPEVRVTPSGTAVGDLRLAINERFRTREGEDKETVCYVDVVVWGRQAETCQKYLTKGSQVLLEGKLQFDQWETEGQKRSKIRVNAQRVQFLGKSGETSSPVTETTSNDGASMPPKLTIDDDNLDDWDPPF